MKSNGLGKIARFLKNTLSVMAILITSIAFVFLMEGAYIMLDMERSISDGIGEVETKITDVGDETSISPTAAYIDEPDVGTGIGEIIFPRKNNYKVAVFEGTSKESLAKGVGRLPSFANLNEVGNCIVFGHRDSSFRNFPDIYEGDIVIAKTPTSTIRYAVSTIFICSPSDSRICDEINRPNARRLTTVTCYPFTFVGPAPQRFVVVAYQTD